MLAGLDLVQLLEFDPRDAVMHAHYLYVQLPRTRQVVVYSA